MQLLIYIYSYIYKLIYKLILCLLLCYMLPLDLQPRPQAGLRQEEAAVGGGKEGH